MQDAFNSHVSTKFLTSTSPCTNKAIYMLLMQGFGTLNTLILGSNILRMAGPFIALTWNINFNENFQPHVHCETATKYSAILFANLGEYSTEFMQY